MDIASCLQQGLGGGVFLEIDVQPGAKRQGIVGVNDWRGRISVAVRAQAQKGQANNAVIHVLANNLHIPTSDLSIVAGQTSRQKRVLVENVDTSELLAKISRALSME